MAVWILLLLAVIGGAVLAMADPDKRGRRLRRYAAVVAVLTFLAILAAMIALAIGFEVFT